MRLRYTPAAIHDLDEIESYIRDTLQNPEAALNTLSSIADAVELLKDQPYLGLDLGAKIDREVQERYLISGNYIAIYIVGDDVSVLRILDTRTDYMKIIFK